MERIKLQYKWTLKYINKYHKCNTSVSYLKSQIIPLENFHIWQKLFEDFTKLLALQENDIVSTNP